jgi:hypothetical protein
VSLAESHALTWTIFSPSSSYTIKETKDWEESKNCAEKFIGIYGISNNDPGHGRGGS